MGIEGVGAEGSPRSPTAISNITNNNKTNNSHRTSSEKSSSDELEQGIIEEKGIGAEGSLESSMREEEGSCCTSSNVAFGTLARELSMRTRVASSAADPNGHIPLPVADEKSSSRPQLMHELAYLLLVVLAAALRRVLMNCVEVSVSIGE